MEFCGLLWYTAGYCWVLLGTGVHLGVLPGTVGYFGILWVLGVLGSNKGYWWVLWGIMGNRGTLGYCEFCGLMSGNTQH